MKYILTAQVLNPYRRKYKWYDRVKGHSGVDLNFFNENLPSPVSGKIELIAKQKEMGTVIYLADKEHGNIHVFAHMGSVDVEMGQHVVRNQFLGRTGNTGSVTSGPHLHYEIISFKKPEKLIDQVMTRTLQGFKGWNVDPLAYIKNLYNRYDIDVEGKTKE
jgi:murein DD-endopeptidase MepM/ murein hydrolase activator NlpD